MSIFNNITNKTDDERYELMKQATIDVVHQKYFDKYYKQTKKRWLDLARVWDKCITCQKNFVLTSVIHKICWGVYPYDTQDVDLQILYDLIEAELLSNGEAFEQLSNWSVFKRVLNATVDSTVSFGKSGLECVFIEHHHYLRSRALDEICYSKTAHAEHSRHQDICRSYERVVNKLVPASVTWSRKQWGDESNIYKAIDAVYSVDYSEHPQDYDRLVSVARLYELGDQDEDFLWYASNISLLPESLARVIFPQDFELMVAKCYLDAYCCTEEYIAAGSKKFADKSRYMHPVGHFEYESLKNSWMHHLVKQYIANDVYSGEMLADLKKAVFKLEVAA